MLSGKDIAIAKQCQLVIGSYDGNDRACPCYDASECKLTSDQVAEAHDHHQVKQAIEDSRKRYEALTQKVDK